MGSCMSNNTNKIFIIDDNPANTLMLHRLLESEGYLNVQSYNDATVALKEFHEQKPQLILLDLIMPKIDGINFLSKIQSEILLADVTVIILTASHDEERKFQALSLGAQDYIEKPINITETMQRVKNVLNLQQNKKKYQELSSNLQLKLVKTNQDLSTIAITLETVFETSSEFVFIVTEDGSLCNCNKIACEKFNVPASGIWNFYDFFDIKINDSFEKDKELTITDSNKCSLVVEVNSTKVVIEGISHFIYIFKDITLQKEDEINLKYLAETHYITHLPNRFQVKQILDSMLKQTKVQLNIVFISFFENSKIAEVHGHEQLEAIVLSIAQKLFVLAEQQKSNVIHWGGNDFILLIPDPVNNQFLTDISESFHEPLSFHGLELYTSPTLGIYNHKIYSAVENEHDKLIQKALLASYEGYRNKQQITFYDDKLQKEIQTRAKIENDLITAIEQRSFKIAYQPKVNLATKHITGLEALVRWQHPTLGLVSPAIFIPIAENAGLVKQIGDIVLDIVTSDISKLKLKYIDLQHVAINVAAPQLDDTFIKQLALLSESKKIDNSFIELEITETTFLDDFDRVIPILNEINKLGFKLAIDDFGTGYSSLSYLHQLPVNTLKIDRSFIISMVNSQKGLKLVKSIISMSLSLDLEIVAEGIEDEETGALLLELGVQLGQGYHYYRPEFL